MDSQYERLAQPPQPSQSAQSQTQPPAQPSSYTQMHMHMQAPSHQHHLYAHDPYLQTQPSAPMYPQTYFAPSAYGLHPSYSSADLAIPPISSLPASITLQSLQHIMDVPYSLLPLNPQSPPTRSARDHSLPFHSPLTSFAHQDPLPTDDEDDEAPRPPPLRTAAKSGAPPPTVGDAAEERRSQGRPPHRSETTATTDAASGAWTSPTPTPQPCDSPPTPTQRQAAATAAAAATTTTTTTGADAAAVLPVPPQFEEVRVQHRLDVRWEFVFYKSTGYCANRRRYLARCKYCDYEIEGRPERLERHALVHCKRLPDAVRATYRDAVQRMGKLSVPEDEVSAMRR
jgi:hypothetical protein